jgi:hypothetical protein
LQDAAEGRKVLEFVMRFLDGGGRWLGSGVAEASLAVLQAACEAEHQRYLLFSCLLRHAATADTLAPAERAAVLRLAVAESGQLEAGLAAPALLLALRELPLVIAAQGGPLGLVPPMAQLQPIAPEGDGGTAGPALRDVQLAPLPAKARAAVAAGTSGSGGGADLHSQVLAAVRPLAAAVEDGLQLLEVVAGTVSKLRGPAPASTAALQCCMAAAQVQHATPKVGTRLIVACSLCPDTCNIIVSSSSAVLLMPSRTTQVALAADGAWACNNRTVPIVVTRPGVAGGTQRRCGPAHLPLAAAA